MKKKVILGVVSVIFVVGLILVIVNLGGDKKQATNELKEISKKSSEYSKTDRSDEDKATEENTKLTEADKNEEKINEKNETAEEDISKEKVSEKQEPNGESESKKETNKSVTVSNHSDEENKKINTTTADTHKNPEPTNKSENSEPSKNEELNKTDSSQQHDNDTNVEKNKNVITLHEINYGDQMPILSGVLGGETKYYDIDLDNNTITTRIHVVKGYLNDDGIAVFEDLGDRYVNTKKVSSEDMKILKDLYEYFIYFHQTDMDFYEFVVMSGEIGEDEDEEDYRLRTTAYGFKYEGEVLCMRGPDFVRMIEEICE